METGSDHAVVESCTTYYLVAITGTSTSGGAGALGGPEPPLRLPTEGRRLPEGEIDSE